MSSPTTVSGSMPLASGTFNNCTKYDQYFPATPGRNITYNINSCYAIARFHGLTVPQFTLWNPSLKFDQNDPNACELKPGLRYCVSNVGKIAPSSRSPTITSAPSSSRAGSTSPGVSTTTRTGTCSGGVPPPEKTQSGEPCWCQKWVKQVDGQFCGDMANKAGITLDQLYALNPPLKSDCSGLFQGYAYCVGPVPKDPACVGGTRAPSRTQPGIPCKCNKWIKQEKGRFCADMAASARIPLERLYTLNPALKRDCTGLFEGYAYCIGLAP